MKKGAKAITHQGLISLEIKPEDTIAWKMSMLLEACVASEDTIGHIAQKYGYTREHFYVIKSQFETKGSMALQDKLTGPKTNYVRTKEIERQVIRHRFLDPGANSEVIAQKMNQSGHSISQRSVERTIKEYGLQKKGYIKQLRKQKDKRLKS